MSSHISDDVPARRGDSCPAPPPAPYPGHVRPIRRNRAFVARLLAFVAPLVLVAACGSRTALDIDLHEPLGVDEPERDASVAIDATVVDAPGVPRPPGTR